MDFTARPTLTGDLVTLAPLSPEHAADLAEAVAAGELWTTWYATHIAAPETMADDIDARLALHAAGQSVPWAIVDNRTGHAVGITTVLNLEPANRRLEIGSTWIGREFQRTGINTEAKLLLLRHAFESLGCIAVEFRVHWHNQQSRAAVARLGAKQDGVLRNHKVWPDGTIRDTVVFSIIDGEWPTVRQSLIQRLAAARSPR
ncbi:RimJ/RimL family protein N-acetyltransferase [Frondihabitans sp. PhB188]|uniref:GNAT family N-acetyltransferase n=1 Tax=Frondihabitans sp. PhB188 TaxID=2485200 RepID=UPI000F4AA4FB|nr:GNAT family protein [Frondihabitans sp. PhB188]ROQ37266.1 RimJ/RimL family protein N-acetyltransferase [Frondihabitans sp. PhB188]